MRGGSAFGADVVKYACRFPCSVNSHSEHDRGADKKQDAGGLVGVLVFEQAAESAADEQGRDGGDRREDVPYRADLAGHRMLLAERRSQPVLSAGDEKERGRQQHDRDEQRP